MINGNTETIIFKLIGTSKSKKQCPSCGKKWKSKYEFGPNDGTYLE